MIIILEVGRENKVWFLQTKRKKRDLRKRKKGLIDVENE